MHSHALMKKGLHFYIPIGRTPLIRSPTSLLSIFHPRVHHRQGIIIVRACPRYQEGLHSCHEFLLLILRITQQRALAGIDDNAGRVGSDSDPPNHATKTRLDKAWHSANLPLCTQILSHWQASKPERLWRPTDGPQHQKKKEAVRKQVAKPLTNYKVLSWNDHGRRVPLRHGRRR